MDEMQFLGYVITAIITLASFVAVVQKLTQPINDLKLVIQELRDCVAELKNDNATQNRRIVKHGEEIDELRHRVGVIETKIEMQQIGTGTSTP